MNFLREFFGWLRWHLGLGSPDGAGKGLRGHLREIGEWLRWQWEVRPIVVLAVVVLVAGGIALGILFQPLQEMATRREAEALREEAREAAAAGDWAVARVAAMESLQFGEALEPLRIVVEAARNRKDPDAMEFAARLFVHPEADATDRAGALAMVLDAGDLVRAGNLVSRDPEALAGDLDLRYEVLRFRLGAGDIVEALELAERDLPGERRPAFDLLVADGLARTGDEAYRSGALDRIARVLDHPDDATALEALRVAATFPDAWVTGPLADAVLQRFRDPSALASEDRLHLALFELNSETVAREPLVASMVAACRDEALAPLARWLVRVGEVEQALALTDPIDFPEGLPREVSEIRLEALVDLGYRETLEAELREFPPDLPEAEVLAHQSAVATSLGKEAEAIVFWKKATAKAEQDLDENHFFRIAAIAGAAGATEHRMDALARGIEHPRGFPPPARELGPLLDWLDAQGDTERLLAVSYRLLKREPDEPRLAGTYHYLRALHEVPDPRAMEVLPPMVERHPDHAGLRAALAFVQLRSGDAEASLATLAALDGAPGALDGEARAVYASALRAVNRWREANALAADIEWERFAEEEAAILRALVKGR